MKFEDVLAEVNGFGKFQIRTVLLTAIPRISLPLHFLLNNFIAAIPPHHCDISSLDDGGIFRNLSQAERLVVSIPVQEDGTQSSCQMFTEPQYHLLLNSSNITELQTVPCQDGWVYDNSTFKSTLASDWDLVCDNRRANKAAATIFFMGVMVGAAVFGYLSDRFGRKSMLLVSYIVAAVFGIASAFSFNYTMFAVMRFFTGFGISGIGFITVALCVEWVDIKHRAVVSVLASLDWSFGMALLSLIAYSVRDWRYLTVIANTPLILAMATWRWVPESARWLISNGKIQKAHFYLRKCAQVNGREQFMADLKPEKPPTSILFSFLPCFLDLAVSQVSNDMGVFRTAVAALGKMFSEGAFTTVYLYTTELYPTVMRQNGLGFCSFAARFGVSVAPLIMVLEEVWGHLPGTVFTLVAFVCGMATLCLSDTSKVRLPETIEDVEQTRRRSDTSSEEKSPL
ncbi:solute carrier family 22 member 7-like [Xyrichtys novacula]|uniref:Solute carrier family 22 member 7-like n=1 Tax=Xyrichtys novacula TaxID=13765 RepID=A0AAV1EUH7_XYRNO|nr:solute carrier family 22 member 7-like [Xyrichtys novacula]